MAKSRSSERKRSSILKLKLVLEKLQNSLSLNQPHRTYEFGQVQGGSPVPKDVKEGHFAVFAVHNGRLKRFVIELRYLKHPSFLRLLEQSAEEFGFKQEGALAIPCQPSELERILSEQWKEERDGKYSEGYYRRRF